MKILLVDYKGKYTIAVDESHLGDMGIVVGETDKETLKKEVEERRSACEYYGIPAYIGDDEELKELFK